METYDKNGKLVTLATSEEDEDFDELEDHMTSEDDELSEDASDFVEDDEVGIVEE